MARFWPFARSRMAEEIAHELGETVVGSVAQIRFELADLVKRFGEVVEAGDEVKRMEKRLLTLERVITKLEGVRDDDMQRVSASLELLRGQITGVRGGRPPRDREATELGQRVLSAMQSPAQLAAFIAELQAIANPPNGPGPFQRSSPV